MTRRGDYVRFDFCADEQCRIISWNEEIAEFTGISESSVLGKKYYEVLPRIFVEDKDAILQVFEKKKELVLREYSFNCLAGKLRADISIKPLRTNGTAHAVEVAFVPGSTCSVAQKVQDLKRFIDIGKMASTLAHGVRNPLNAIKGAVVYLRERYANEPTLSEFTRIIEDEISRLDSFISTFLSTTVSEAQLSTTDINSLLSKIKVMTSFQAQARGIESVYEHGDIPPLMINPFHLEQAILNIINNAIHAMSEGGKLTVKTMVEKIEGSSFVIIEISDTGPGMLESHIDNLASRNRGGKGFGLFITDEVLKRHGGHLEVKSRRKEGTTVKLYLPIREERGLDERG